MKKNMKWKALLILAVVGLSIWGFTPPSEKIKLGLDLKGGIHLVMKVKTEDAIVAVTDEIAGMLGQQLDDKSISFQTAERAESGRIAVTGVDINKDSELRELVTDELSRLGLEESRLRELGALAQARGDRGAPLGDRGPGHRHHPPAGGRARRGRAGHRAAW